MTSNVAVIGARLTGIPRVLVAALASSAIASSGPDTIGVPLRNVAVNLVLLASGGFAVLIPSSVASPLWEPEFVAARGTPERRLQILAWLMVASLMPVMAVLVLHQDPDLTLGVTRNVLMCSSVALISSVLLPAGASWSLPSLLLAGCFVFGMSESGAPHSWALLLSTSDRMNFSIAVLTLLIAVLLFVTRGPRPSELA